MDRGQHARDDSHRPGADLRRRARARFVAGEFEAARVLRASGSGEPPAGAFRERLRAEFAGGALEQRAADRAALRRALDRRADPSFRSRLAARFVLGELEPASAAPEAPAELAPLGTEPQPLAPVHDLDAARRRRRPLVVAGLVAAAALLLTTLPSFLGPHWRPRPDADVSGVVFDRKPLDGAGDLPARTDRVLACGPEALRLSLEDRALVQLSPAAQIRFCAPVWTLFGDVRAPVHVDAGTLDVQTLDGEEGLDLELDTPNAVVRLDRGALSIKVNEHGTCVVVERGSATVRSAAGGDEVRVGEGERVFVPRGAGTCRLEQGYTASNPDAEARLRSLRAMLVDVEAGVF